MRQLIEDWYDLSQIYEHWKVAESGNGRSLCGGIGVREIPIASSVDRGEDHEATLEAATAARLLAARAQAEPIALSSP